MKDGNSGPGICQSKRQTLVSPQYCLKTKHFAPVKSMERHLEYAYEATGRIDLAMQDVLTLLQVDASHQDELELVKRLCVVLGNKRDAQQRPAK